MLAVALLFLSPPLDAAGDVITNCLDPCHYGLGEAPDIATTWYGPAENAGHKMNWDSRVIADTSGALLPQGAKMPCSECHVTHGVETSIYNFSTARNGGVPIVTIRTLCEGCHLPYDSSAPAVTVKGLVMKKLPASTSAHGDASVLPCSDCHGASGHAPEGHGAGGAACSDCHGSDGSHAVHTDAGDLRGPNGLSCGGCHDTGNYPGFATGTDSDGSGQIDLDETTVCDTCHSPGGGYDGVDSAAGSVGARTNWDAGVYEADKTTLQPGKEKWCVGCHDGDDDVTGEKPAYIASVYAPPVGGNRNGGFRYGTGWGYYQTGHGLSSSKAYPSSGGVAMGAALECDACHEFGVEHIDGDDRTYSAAVFDNGNAYRAGFRLRQVDLGAGLINPMRLPFPDQVTTKEAFALCASCHDPAPFLGTNSDTNLTYSGANNHARHMAHGSGMNGRYDSDWGGGNESRISCTLCHNVHGSQRLAMARDGSLVDREPGFQFWYGNPALVYNESWNVTPPNPQNLPLIQSLGLIMLETSTGPMCGTCHNRSYTSYYPRTSLRWKGNVPALDWTFEEYYIGRGVGTDRVFDTTYDAPFRIKYFDPNNDAPSAIQVWVDLDDSGTYEPGEKTTMTKDDPGDVNYTDGAIYRANVTVTDPGDKTMRYRFYASDGTNVAVGAPVDDQTLVWDDNFLRDVPGEYASIQAAIDAAYDGNVIAVSDGSYPETIDYRGKELTIYSLNGASATTITGSGGNTPCVKFTNGETSAVLEGFTVDNSSGGGTADGPRGVIIGAGATPTIRDCEITGNRTYTLVWGGGIRIDGGGLVCEDTTITGNWGRRGGGVYAHDTSEVISFTDCWIDNNNITASGEDGGGLYLVNISTPVTFTRTSVSGNASGTHGGGIAAQNTPLEFVDCTLNGNVGGNSSGEHGGAIYLTGASSSVTLTNCTVDGNQSASGGGIYLSGSTQPVPLNMTGGSVSNNTSPNGHGVGIYLDNCANTSYLTDVTINNNVGYGSGAGVRTNSSLTIDSCTITNNRSTHTVESGGGIYATGASTVITITDTQIDNNQSNEGAGIRADVSQLTITGGSISNNNTVSQHSGGGLRCSGTVSVTGTSIVGNTAGYSGGGIFCTGPSLTVTGCTITDNVAGTNSGTNGGGIYVSGGSTIVNITDTDVRRGRSANIGGGIYAHVSQFTMTGGSISQNTVTGQQNGGGLSCSGTVVLRRVHIQGNTCGHSGGGVSCTGGSLTMTNCTVTGNQGGSYVFARGGGIHSGTSSTSIVNCTVTANYCRDAGGISGGGGTMKNCIVWNNFTGGSILNAEAATVSYSDISGSGYTNGGNNINANPLFVTPSSAYPSVAGDFHLQSSPVMSPCEGAATSAGAPADDIDGGARPVGSGYDIGSDEIGAGAPAMLSAPVSFTLPVKVPTGGGQNPAPIPGPPAPAPNMEIASPFAAPSGGFLLVGTRSAPGSSESPVRTSSSLADLKRDGGSVPELPALPASVGALSILALAWKALLRLLGAGA